MEPRRGVSGQGARPEQSPEQIESLLRRLTDALPGLVAYVDRDQRYVFANRLYETWFGRPPAAVVGRTIADVLGPALMVHTAPHIDRALCGEEVQFTFEGPYPGAPRWVHASYLPDRDADGNVQGFFVFVVDDTARKLAEQALRDSEARHRLANQALQAADRRKDEFLATISHELRNPLAAISNAVSVLKEAPSPDATTQWVSEVVDRQIRHLSRLLEDLLDVSRVAHNKLVLRKEYVSLADVVRVAMETCRHELDAAGHRLSVALPPGVLLLADAVRMAQVFSNLIGNAARYTRPGGTIVVTAERRADEVVVSVKDDGVGIAPDLLPRVFEMFSQGERTFERTGGGLGLGLSLVKGLLDLHGGRIEARSDGVGKGSEFIVTLPAAIAARANPPPAARVPALVRGRKVSRVLVADDLADITNGLAIVMRHFGFEVHTAYDGEQAVARAEEIRPEIAILDLGMPKIDGYEACRRIRGHDWGRRMTLIAMTGWGGATIQERTGAAGFNHHLVKPVEAAALLHLLASLEPPPPAGAPC
jgi:PAS domain S-box-containing protein